MADYHKCAREVGKCKGLKQGIKGYHKCATASNCKKPDREKVAKVAKKIKASTKARARKKRENDDTMTKSVKERMGGNPLNTFPRQSETKGNINRLLNKLADAPKKKVATLANQAREKIAKKKQQDKEDAKSYAEGRKKRDKLHNERIEKAKKKYEKLPKGSKERKRAVELYNQKVEDKILDRRPTAAFY